MLKNKTVLLGVTGGIAAYKIPNLASMLVKQGCIVHVLMTQNATNFINPIAFENLTGTKCLIDTFDRNFVHNAEHIAISKRADVFMVAPASANIIGKMAHGIADDMLTTTMLACTCPKIIAPSMNTNMYENPIVQDNIAVLKRYGFQIITPASGYLACGDTGAGKLPTEQELFDAIEHTIAYEKDLIGKSILVTAGPTVEPLDPVRFVSNHSTGKMGYAIAKAASLRGAQVTLVSGPTALEPPRYTDYIAIQSAREMFDAVTSRADKQDIIIKAAAVADYRPKQVSDEKIKKKDGDLSIEMERNPDILAFLGEHRTPGQFLCGFSMETQNMLENSRAKLTRKKIDMIAANSLKQQGAGFGGDTNILTLITTDQEKQLDIMSKDAAAHALLDEILGQL